MAERKKTGAGGLALVALLIGLAAPLCVMVGALGTKFGAWDYATGLRTFGVEWGVRLAWAGLAANALALVLAFFGKGRGLVLALIGLLAAGGTLYGFSRLRATAKANPVHDISTDWTEPLAFSPALMAERERTGAKNAVEPDPGLEKDGASRRVADIGAETCPAAKPVLKAVTPDQAAAALEAAGAKVSLKTADRVEGTHESLWFGFKDDVVVRLRPDRADVRSISRVGGSDLGANCRRVTKIVEALNR